MRFSAARYALRSRSSSSTDLLRDPSSFFQSIPLSPLPRRLTWMISMGEHAMKFKVKHTSWWRRNLWESNAFGYFGHTGALDADGGLPLQARHAPGLGVLSSPPGIHHGRLQCAGPVAWLPALCVG